MLGYRRGCHASFRKLIELGRKCLYYRVRPASRFTPNSYHPSRNAEDAEPPEPLCVESKKFVKLNHCREPRRWHKTLFTVKNKLHLNSLL